MRRKLILAAIAAVAFCAGYGGLAHAYPSPAPFGRAEFRGYFSNSTDPDNSGTFVMNNIYSMGSAGYFAIPKTVTSIATLESFIGAKYNDGNVWDETGASFIIETMIGNATAVRPKPATLTQFNTWKAELAALGANGGTVAWNVSGYCYTLNTYYMYGRSGPGPKDDAFFDESLACTNSTFPAIVFSFPGGKNYAIRRQCANPVGRLDALPGVAPKPFDLNPNITITSGATPLPDGSFVEAGQPITFKYTVLNTSVTTATSIACTAHANNYAGYNTTLASGPSPPGVTCTSTFPPGTTNLGSEAIAAAPANTSLCRSLTVNPSATAGGPETQPACVFVVTKPYMRVYGGDVSAGNPISADCTTVPQAGIVGWNKEAAGAFAGAGARYGVLAVDEIYDFSAALGNAGGTPPPDGVAFTNTGVVSGGLFGGNYDSPPCMTDYYGALPSTNSSLPSNNIGALSTATYTATGPITLTGSLNPGQRTAIYVDGDVLITGAGIDFPAASWTTANLPFFEVIAKGNIYISQSVTSLAGLYVAQADGAGNGGLISDCANPTLPVVSYDNRLSGAVFKGPCSNKLTVNGAFVAQQIELLRTSGTLRSSVAGEPNSSANQAETFNYTPALWMAMPPNLDTNITYDSITSLSPIL
ncbi:MAG TPA: hypothetical protein VLH84_03035 [Patescibacteria group bacterium]|nr:hypothetical protein [Patescibacteria group bacterium]